MADKISIDDFNKTDIRVGEIIEVLDFPEARRPACKLKINIGPELGVKNSSAQITVNYSKEDLLKRHVLCVVNLPPRQIGNFLSEVLTLGVPDENGNTILVEPAKEVPLGAKLY